MNHPFYKYVLTFRGGPQSDLKALFAEGMYNDLTFPKYSTDFDEVSSYIEELAHQDMTATIFDELWLLYETNVGFQSY